MKFERLSRVHDGKHKYMAVFNDHGKVKKVLFGSYGMDDYTLTGDKLQRDRYRARHKKDLETGDPTRAGYLSYYILWGDSTNIQTNLRHYIHKFHL